MSKKNRPNQKEYHEMQRLKARVDALMGGGDGAESVASIVHAEFDVEYSSQEIVDIYSTGRKIGRDR